ncbi:hypothetical protein [Paenibacillus alvei]|nr:hypothetical protein [Paenibacillus alvei]MEC0082708.1 hypothetical protein [Paenibacillus alvei]
MKTNNDKVIETFINGMTGFYSNRIKIEDAPHATKLVYNIDEKYPSGFRDIAIYTKHDGMVRLTGHPPYHPIQHRLLMTIRNVSPEKLYPDPDYLLGFSGCCKQTGNIYKFECPKCRYDLELAIAHEKGITWDKAINCNLCDSLLFVESASDEINVHII